MSDGTRKVTRISEITGMEGDVITMQEIFTYKQTGHRRGRLGDRHVPRDRHPAEVRRAAQGVGDPLCRWTCSSTCITWAATPRPAEAAMIAVVTCRAGVHRLQRRVVVLRRPRPEQHAERALSRHYAARVGRGRGPTGRLLKDVQALSTIGPASAAARADPRPVLQPQALIDQSG